MPSIAVFAVDLAVTGLLVTLGVQLGRLWARWRGDDGSDDSGGGGPRRLPPRPPGPLRRGRAHGGVTGRPHGGRAGRRPQAARRPRRPVSR